VAPTDEFVYRPMSVAEPFSSGWARRRGPAITGLPHDTGGFIPVDQYAAVPGVQGVWAAGDATDFRIKHGGVSAQMADTAARSIAALAGASITPHKFDPVLDAVLLTGSSPRSLRGRPIASDDARPGLRKLEHDDQTPKIAATYLAPHLTALSSRASDGSMPPPPRDRTVQSDPATVSR
jgi:hypothetical protein